MNTETAETKQDHPAGAGTAVTVEGDTAMVLRSEHNGAMVKAVVYRGPNATLTWELQHELCAAVGRASPGSSATIAVGDHERHLNRHCSYCTQSDVSLCTSEDDHSVVSWAVTDRCDWASDGNRPTFTRVSGYISEGRVGYMCAAAGCRWQVRVENTSVVGNTAPVTLHSGDSVFCAHGPRAIVLSKPQGPNGVAVVVLAAISAALFSLFVHVALTRGGRRGQARKERSKTGPTPASRHGNRGPARARTPPRPVSEGTPPSPRP